MSKTDQDSEDAVQDALMCLLKAVDKLDSQQSPVGYFLRIGIRARMNQLRSPNAKLKTVPLNGVEIDPMSLSVDTEAEREAALLARKAVFEMVLREMNDADRCVVVQVLLNKRPREEVAKELGVARNAIDQRISRLAKRMCQEHIDLSLPVPDAAGDPDALKSPAHSSSKRSTIRG